MRPFISGSRTGMLLALFLFSLSFASAVNFALHGDADGISPDEFLFSWPGGPLGGPEKAPSGRLAAIVPPAPPAALANTSELPPLSPQPLRARRTRKQGPLGAPVAFASRVNSNELNEETETEVVGLHDKHTPLVSCNAAKALVCIGGVVAVGAVGLRLTRDFLRRRRRARLGGSGPESPFSRLLGSVLLSNTNAKAREKGFIAKVTGVEPEETATAEALGETGSITALYFTGRGVEDILASKGYVPFTPRLKSIVEAAKQKGQKLNVVFISADNYTADAAALFKTMPWHAVPFDEPEGRERIRSLYKKFRVTSLPHVVLLDEKGRVTNPQAYTSMLANPHDFPWNKKSPLELLGKKLVNAKGETVDVSSLEGKTVGIYFSASWCPPCQNFTPKLLETLRRLKDRGEQVEVVFVSNDKDEENFKKYFDKMDWLAVPFSDAATRAVAQDTLGVRSLPTLIWVSPKGEILTRRGVASVLKDSEGALFPWKEKTVKDVEDALESIAEEPVLLAFIDGANEEMQQQVQKVMEDAVTALKEGEDEETLAPVPQFLTARQGSARTAALRQICKKGLPADGAGQQVSLLILDVFSQKVYVHPNISEPISKESIIEFVNQYRNEQLEGRPLTLPE